MRARTGHEKLRALFTELGFFNLIKLLEFGQPA